MSSYCKLFVMSDSIFNIPYYLVVYRHSPPQVTYLRFGEVFRRQIFVHALQ
jgi:hypothetical protein